MGINILVVDDEKLIRSVIKDYLENENMNVLEAENGLEALRIFKEEKIDLIILDIMMPKMDGVETLNKLKEINNFNIPVIALTADAMEGTKEKYISAGFNDYLSKPINKEELNKVLNRYIQGESYIDIANKLDSPVKAIDNAIQRIRKKAIKCLSNEE